MQDLDETLRSLKEKTAARDHLRGLLARAKASLDGQLGKLHMLKLELKAERDDVTRLEGLTLTALFHTVLSSKTEQLEKERQEVLRAKLRHDECHAAVSSLGAETARLEGALAQLGDIDVELEEALRRKEEVLLSSDGLSARRLFEIADARAEAHAETAQIREATKIGERADDTLDDVSASLEHARSWGTWDMLGGGFIVTALKHSRIDESAEHVRDAQEDLRQFESALEDVHFDEDLSSKLEGFDRFADFFFDGLIFDWVVQSKIVRSLGEVARVQDRVVETLRMLDGRMAELKNRLSSLEAERRALVERGF